MTNAVDNNFLAMLLHPDVKPPINPNTGILVDRIPERMAALVDTWNRRGDRLIIPIPALAEFLVLAGADANTYLSELNNLATVYLRPFDLRAAIELASMEIDALKSGQKRHPADASAPWQKVKIARQIVAIAKVAGVESMFTDDKDVGKFARAAGMHVVSSWDLSVPASTGQLFSNAGDVDLE